MFHITFYDVPSLFGMLTIGDGHSCIHIPKLFGISFCGLLTAGQAPLTNVAAPCDVAVEDRLWFMPH
jgi:hypothetical protein